MKLSHVILSTDSTSSRHTGCHTEPPFLKAVDNRSPGSLHCSHLSRLFSVGQPWQRQRLSKDLQKSSGHIWKQNGINLESGEEKHTNSCWTFSWKFSLMMLVICFFNCTINSVIEFGSVNCFMHAWIGLHGYFHCNLRNVLHAYSTLLISTLTCCRCARPIGLNAGIGLCPFPIGESTSELDTTV